MRVKRLEAVEAYIRQVGSVSMQQLCQEFDVSINTIRRDIDTLVQKGQVKKGVWWRCGFGQNRRERCTGYQRIDGFSGAQSGMFRGKK